MSRASLLRALTESPSFGPPVVAPAKRGRPIVPDADRLVIFNVRLTRAQIAKLKALGGPEWMRKRIDQAKLPA